MNKFINDLIQKLNDYYDGFVGVFPQLVLAVITFIVLLFIANRAQKIISTKLSIRMDDPLLAKFLGRVVRSIITIFALMLVMKIIGLADIAAGLLAGASVSAVVVGFAFKDIAENFLAGIMLAFNRPFRVGDTVELDGIKGKVVSLDMRTSQIKSFDGKDIYIPNASVIKNPVINYTIDGFMRQEFTVGLDYGSDIDKAIDILKNTILKIDGVIKDDKKPNVHINDLNTSTLDVTVQYWLNTFDTKFPGTTIRTNAINRSLIALDEAGFYMPGEVIELKNYNDNEIATGPKLNKDVA